MSFRKLGLVAALAFAVAAPALAHPPNDPGLHAALIGAHDTNISSAPAAIAPAAIYRVDPNRDLAVTLLAVIVTATLFGQPDNAQDFGSIEIASAPRQNDYG